MRSIMRRIKRDIKNFIIEAKRPANIILFSVAVLVLSYMAIRHYSNRGKVLANPVELEGIILKVTPCFKNGKCIEYEYEYQETVYQREARVSWSFANWCRSRNNCKGMKFKVLIQEGNPGNTLVFWEDMYEAAKKTGK